MPRSMNVCILSRLTSDLLMPFFYVAWNWPQRRQRTPRACEPSFMKVDAWSLVITFCTALISFTWVAGPTDILAGSPPRRYLPGYRRKTASRHIKQSEHTSPPDYRRALPSRPAVGEHQAKARRPGGPGPIKGRDEEELLWLLSKGEGTSTRHLHAPGGSACVWECVFLEEALLLLRSSQFLVLDSLN
jgi:hypothetical protein